MTVTAALSVASGSDRAGHAETSPAETGVSVCQTKFCADASVRKISKLWNNFIIIVFLFSFFFLTSIENAENIVFIVIIMIFGCFCF